MFDIESKILNYYKNKKLNSIPSRSTEEEVKLASKSTETDSEEDGNEEKKKQERDFPRTREDLIKSIIVNKTELGGAEKEIVESTKEALDNGVKSDEQIEEIAKKNAEIYNEQQKKAIEDDYKLKVDELNAKKDQTVKDVENSANDAYSSANDKKESVMDKAIKNNVSRSSILDAQIEEIDKFADAEIKAITEKANKKLLENENDLKLAEENYNNAIENLSVSGAVQYGEELKKLKNERKELIESLGFKYDGSSKFGLDLSSLDNQALTNVKNIISDTLRYYSQMDAKEAFEKYKKDTELKELLGSYAEVVEKYLKSYAR